MGSMSQCLRAAAVAAVLLVLVAAAIEAACSDMESCGKCLSSQAGMLERGSSCKWCPASTMNPAVFSPEKRTGDGICISVGSTGPEAAWTGESRRPGCFFEHGDRGWLTKSKVLSHQEADSDCEDARRNDPGDPSASPDHPAHKYAEPIPSEIYRSALTFGCSGWYSCVDCLMETPAYGGSHCKFCPKETLSIHWPVDTDARRQSSLGACVDGSEGKDPKSSDTREGTEGGCVLTRRDSPKHHIGWLNGGQRMTHEEALELCRSYKKPDNGDVAQVQESVLTSALALSNAAEMTSQQQSLRVLASLGEDVMRILYLRATDTQFFLKSFKEDDSVISPVGREFLSAGVDTAATVLNMGAIYTPIRLTYQAYAWLRDRYGQLSSHGAGAHTLTFQDVAYEQLWKAYKELLPRVYRASDESKGDEQGEDPRQMLLDLKRTTADIIHSNAQAFQKMSSAAHKVWSHGATQGTKYGVHMVIAAATHGLSLPVSLLIMGGDYLLSQGFEAGDAVNYENKLKVLMAGVYAQEATIRHLFMNEARDENIVDNQFYQRGRVVCNIMQEDHGCRPDFFCKREFVFFPADRNRYRQSLFSPIGLCAPRYRRQLENGMPCSLCSECKSGHCSFGASRVQRGSDSFIVSAGDRFFRGDMGIDRPNTEAFSETIRRTITLGLCKRAARPHTRGCHPISSRHQYWECPPEEDEELEVAAKQEPQAKRSQDDSAIGTRPPSPVRQRLTKEVFLQQQEQQQRDTHVLVP